MTQAARFPSDRLLTDLQHLCALPGSASHYTDLAVVAQRVAALMDKAGLRTDLIPTAGAPVVRGWRAGRSPFTLLLYHHYDVAPPGPWRAWHHEPFQLAEREGALYGRGVAHGKGPLLAHLSALAALLETEGELPCGVVVLAEGEGLSGSPNLAAAVARMSDTLPLSACLATGGERDRDGKPVCYGGAKGLLHLRLTAVGANQSLDPGIAASVSNPLWRLLWAITQIKSDQEEILVAGFYDSVSSPSRAENKSNRAVRLNESGRLEAWGLANFLFGMSGPTLVSAEATLPTCNVSALMTEPHSDLAMMPMVAAAQLDFQLVPNQRPHTILDLVRTHLAAKGFEDVQIERLPGGYVPFHTSLEHSWLQRVRESGATLYGAPLPGMSLGPFTLPLGLLCEAQGTPAAVVGCAPPDSATFGPNEHILLDNLVNHGQLLAQLLRDCAENPPGA